VVDRKPDGMQVGLFSNGECELNFLDGGLSTSINIMFNFLFLFFFAFIFSFWVCYDKITIFFGRKIDTVMDLYNLFFLNT